MELKGIEQFKMNRPRVDRILSQFPRRRILVFGDVGLDKYTVGKVSRISPEAPIPVVEVAQTRLKLGLAANVADNIAALGGQALLVGLVGKDHAAREFMGLLKDRAIATKYLVTDGARQTTLKERVVAEVQQVVRIDHESQAKIGPGLLRQVWNRLAAAMDEADAVIVEDYAKGLLDAAICRQLIALAVRQGKPVFVDPNRRSAPSLYYGCTVMTPNTQEAEALSGIEINGSASLERAGMRLLDQANAGIVIITRGREGMAIFARGEKQPLVIPTFAREVFDVSGAGDTTIATLALAVVSGANIVEASLLANFAAGVEVGKWGTATVTAGEIREYIDFVGAWNARKKRSN